MFIIEKYITACKKIVRLNITVTKQAVVQSLQIKKYNIGSMFSDLDNPILTLLLRKLCQL